MEHVEGSEISVVILTADGAEKIGLELAQVRRVSHAAGGLAVPYEALVHDADGTIWVYAADGDPLRFRRQAVEVAAVDGGQAILTSGPERRHHGCRERFRGALRHRVRSGPLT